MYACILYVHTHTHIYMYNIIFTYIWIYVCVYVYVCVRMSLYYIFWSKITEKNYIIKGTKFWVFVTGTSSVICVIGTFKDHKLNHGLWSSAEQQEAFFFFYCGDGWALALDSRRGCGGIILECVKKPIWMWANASRCKGG